MGHPTLAPRTLTLLQAGHQLVDDVLHDAVQLEVEQRLRLVDLGVAHGAVFAGLQVLDDAALADCSQRGVSGAGGGTAPQPQTPALTRGHIPLGPPDRSPGPGAALARRWGRAAPRDTLGTPQRRSQREAGTHRCAGTR